MISGGKIVDGTGNPWYYGDVGIKRRSHRAPSRRPARSRTRDAGKRIDAKGMVIAPGFIDIQGQSAEQLTTGDGRVISKVTQGVTTEILGEGDTPAPVNDKILATFDASDTAGVRVAKQFMGDARLRRVARRDGEARQLDQRRLVHRRGDHPRVRERRGAGRADAKRSSTRCAA